MKPQFFKNSSKPDMLKFFLEKTRDVVIPLNEKLEVVFLSETFEKLFEFKNEELLGTRLDEIIHNFPPLPMMKLNSSMVIPMYSKLSKNRILVEFNFIT